MNKKKKDRDDDYMIGEATEEVWDALGAVDALRLQLLEGAAQRLGPGATLAEAIDFFKDPGPEPPPDRVPPSRRPQA